jgi:WD40 repeat protein
LWDLASRKKISTVKRKESIRGLATNADDHVIIYDGLGYAGIGNLRTLDKITFHQIHDGVVTDATFSPDGTRIATASWDGTAKLWGNSGRWLIGELKGHEGSVDRVMFTPDGRRIITLGSDNTARVWNVEIPWDEDKQQRLEAGTVGVERVSESFILRGTPHMPLFEVARLQISPDGNFAVWSVNSNLVLWDIRGSNELSLFNAGSWFKLENERSDFHYRSFFCFDE